MIRILRPGEYQGMKIDAMGQYLQSTLGVFDQDQKFHGLFNLYGLNIDYIYCSELAKKTL